MRLAWHKRSQFRPASSTFASNAKSSSLLGDGTIFSDTHLWLEKWFHPVALMVNAKKGVSALQLKRDLGTAYKTAWYLAMRIRKAISLIELADDEPLTGTIEADETYMGSKKYDKRRKRARYEKEPVFGIIERGGRAKTFHVTQPVNRYKVIPKLQDNIAIRSSSPQREIRNGRCEQKGTSTAWMTRGEMKSFLTTGTHTWSRSILIFTPSERVPA
jgi:hypothetical protein